MTAFTLKTIALVAMLLDHLAVVFPCYFPIEFRAVGRLAFPIFAYLLAESFRHTKASEKFLLRLFVFAIISQIPYRLALTWASQQNNIPWTQAISFTADTNIFYTLFLGGAAIVVYQRLKSKGKNLTAYVRAVFPTAVIAELLFADYGGMGVLFVFCMYAITEKKERLAAMAFFALSQFFPVMLLLMGFDFDFHFKIEAVHFLMMGFALSTVGMVALYNGKRGYSAKWLFYAAYPIHLVVLTIAAILI
jgi:hypothetical protein